jgi:hypothetical protein
VGDALQKNAVRSIVRARRVEQPSAPDVCLKIFKTASRDFHAEARYMASLRHPLIVQLEGSYTDSAGRGVLVMRFYEDGSLRRWFDHIASRKGALSQPEWSCVRHVFRQILHALAFLHSHRVAHRDLKPENMMWSDRSRDSIVLADFGVARDLNLHLETTRLIQAAGTVGYAAPEASTPSWKAYPWACDIWAVGVMALHVATGMLWSWNAVAGRLERLTDKGTTAFAAPPSASASAQELITLARACLQPEPSARPSADEALLHAFFMSLQGEAGDTRGPAEGDAAGRVPALAAKFNALSAALGAARASICDANSAFSLRLPVARGDAQSEVAFCRALLNAVGGAQPAELLRSWEVRAGDEQIPLAAAMQTFWTALPRTGLFQQFDGGHESHMLPFLPIAAAEPAQLRMLEAVGRVLARCLLDGVAVSCVEFAPTLYAALVGTCDEALRTPGAALAHAAAFDAGLASQSRSMLASRLGSGSDLVTVDQYLENDDESPVCDANKERVVCAHIRRLLVDRRRTALAALHDGFDAITAAAGLSPVLQLLSEWELGSQLSSASVFFDRELMRRRVQWAAEWPEDHPQRGWMDTLLAALSAPALRLLMVRSLERVRLSSDTTLLVLRGEADRHTVLPRFLGNGMLELAPNCPSYEAFAGRMLRVLGLDLSAADQQAVSKEAVIEEARAVIRAAQAAGIAQQGAVYSCSCGFIYLVSNCGGAMEIQSCPECGLDIGGLGHYSVEGNQVRLDLDDASEAAYGHEGFRPASELHDWQS